MTRYCGAWACERLERRVALASLPMASIGEIEAVVARGEEQFGGMLDNSGLRLQVLSIGGQHWLSIIGTDGLRRPLAAADDTANHLLDDWTDLLLADGPSRVIELWVEFAPAYLPIRLHVDFTAGIDPTVKFVSRPNAGEAHEPADSRLVVDASSALGGIVHFQHPSSVTDLGAGQAGHLLANAAGEPHFVGPLVPGSIALLIPRDAPVEHGFGHEATSWSRAGSRMRIEQELAGDRSPDRSHGAGRPPSPVELPGGMNDERLSWSDSIDQLHGHGAESDLTSEELLEEMGEWPFDQAEAPRPEPTVERVGEPAADDALPAVARACQDALTFVAVMAPLVSMGDLDVDAGQPLADDDSLTVAARNHRSAGWAVVCVAGLAACELERRAARITTSAVRWSAAEAIGHRADVLQRQDDFAP